MKDLESFGLMASKENLLKNDLICVINTFKAPYEVIKKQGLVKGGELTDLIE